MLQGFKPRLYLKDDSFDPIYSPINKRFLTKSRIYPGIILTLGLIILATQVVIPLVDFKTADEISKPMGDTVLGTAVGFSEFKFGELKNNGKTTEKVDINIPKYFYLSIPKLGIKNAMVETNSTNLVPDKALGHYNGSALPGEVGNTFIYGHSVLPWFYNPRNYKTIFSTLDSLKTGDVIYIKYNNRQIEYKIEDKIVQKPEEVNALAEFKPRYLNESTIVLMTCTPPGTKLKRLLVRGVMVKSNL